jgi:hypothetical protein
VPTDRALLLALADRVEWAAEPDTDVVFSQAARVLWPIGSTDEAGCRAHARYALLCVAEAYLDAAASVVPKGWRLVSLRRSKDAHHAALINERRKWAAGDAGTEHQARLAAALRARAEDAAND